MPNSNQPLDYYKEKEEINVIDWLEQYLIQTRLVLFFIILILHHTWYFINAKEAYLVVLDQLFTVMMRSLVLYLLFGGVLFVLIAFLASICSKKTKLALVLEFIHPNLYEDSVEELLLDFVNVFILGGILSQIVSILLDCSGFVPFSMIYWFDIESLK